MFVPGAPAGGYCAATCSRCPLGSTPAAAVPSPSVILPAAAAPVPAAAAAACVDLPPNENFSCAQLVSAWPCLLWCSSGWNNAPRLMSGTHTVQQHGLWLTAY